jgi:hypothetical protein
MLFSTFLCQGKFVHRYVHPVPTYIFLYVKNRLSPFLTKHSPNNNQLPAPPLLSSCFGLRLSYLSPLPTPLSPLPSPHSRLPSRSLSILFGLLSCCLIVPASRHVVLHCRVLSRRIVTYRPVAYSIVASLRLRLSLRPLCSAGCSVVRYILLLRSLPLLLARPLVRVSARCCVPSCRRDASRLAAKSYCITASS